jgi:hypothetical protein
MLAVYLQLFLPWSLTTSLKYFSLYPSAPANTVSNIKRRRLSEERNTTRTVSLMVAGAVKLSILHQSEIVCWLAWRCISGRFDNVTCESAIVTLLLYYYIIIIIILLLFYYYYYYYYYYSIVWIIIFFTLFLSLLWTSVFIYFRQFGFLIAYPFVFQLSFVFYNSTWVFLYFYSYLLSFPVLSTLIFPQLYSCLMSFLSLFPTFVIFLSLRKGIMELCIWVSHIAFSLIP